MSDRTSTQQPTAPLSTPTGYDLNVAQACSFMVNVACDMCQQWIKQNHPAASDFTWTPSDPCPSTSGFSVNDYTFSKIIWSTFALPTGEKQTEPFGFIATNTSGDTAYLVFRGSQTTADRLMDAEWAQVPYTSPLPDAPPGMLVEKGFDAVFSGLRECLLTELKAVTAATLYIAGHSLGSALATLAVPEAVSLSLSGTQYNQASPRVGNPAFATHVGGLSIGTLRLVNIYDSVPKAPPSIGDRIYQAVGPEACYGADYPTEADKHDPCCSYSYALFNGANPYNPNMQSCRQSV